MQHSTLYVGPPTQSVTRNKAETRGPFARASTGALRAVPVGAAE